MKKIFASSIFWAGVICFLFFVAYAILGIIRQMHFLSGYDIAVVDQGIWNYSHFRNAISTNHAYAFTPMLWDHVELIYFLIAPFYWIFDSIYTLIILQALAITASGMAVFLLAKKYALQTSVALSLVVSYLMFYGIQNAIWADVHSLVFGVAFLAWFLFFVENGNKKLSWFFFFLTIICKEDMALAILIICFVLFVMRRDKQMLWFMGIATLYLFAIFYVYFSHFVPGGYRFQNKAGLLSNIDMRNFYNTSDKQNVWWYSFLSFGFLPLLSPLFLLPAIGDLAKYFLIANSVVTSGQSIFGHYRSILALLLVWPTIITIHKYKKLNNTFFALYVLIFALFVQYLLHSPLSYLAKKWFWAAPTSVTAMKTMLTEIPQNASVVTQINFLPHLSHRQYEFTLWPQTKNFGKNSPCNHPTCDWFRWAGNPQYLLVDTATDWDARYWLTNRTNFVQGIANLQKMKIIQPVKTIDTTTLYRILHKPN